MKPNNGVIFVFLLSLIINCNESSTEVKEDYTPRISFSADKISGQAPLKVSFTGQFLGRIDTIRVLVPDYVFFPGAGKTIIRYALLDTTQPANPKFTEEFTYGATGSYKAVLLLQSRYKDYYSDTLFITVN